MTSAAKPTKKVIILRGLPGSGKSTWAKQQQGSVICSADHAFERIGGCYEFDPSKLGLAHQLCKRKFLEAVMNKKFLIVVDNTNTRRCEFQPYIEVASDQGYAVEIKTFEISVEESVKRNVHGVPRETIERMAKRWEP